MLTQRLQMTPQETFEYKLKWKPRAYTVRVHSDLATECKDWCRRNCNRWEWSCDTYTGVYEHTFYFERDDSARDFEQRFLRWVQHP